MSSKSHVRIALERIDELDKNMEALIAPLRTERDRLREAADKYVVDHYNPGEGIETDTFKMTKVVGHTRWWNPEKLEKLVPRGIYKNLVEVKVLPAKVDEYVRKGKIKRADIEAAFEERPNKPYVKMTKKEQGDARASAEASSLAEALG